MVVTKFIRWTFETFVCLYCSLIYLARVKMNGGSWLLETIDHWAAALDRFMIAQFHVILFDKNSVDLRWFHEEWFGIALMTFVGVRLLSQVRLMERAFPVVGLCLTLAGPLYWSPAVSPEWGTPPRVLLLCLEIVAMMVLLILYGRRNSITTTGLCLVAVLAHFCLWSWVMMGQFDHRYAWPTLISYLILPFCTLLLWGVYARMSPHSGESGLTTTRLR
jgi:hypothetical protein